MKTGDKEGKNGFSYSQKQGQAKVGAVGGCVVRKRMALPHKWKKKVVSYI